MTKALPFPISFALVFVLGCAEFQSFKPQVPSDWTRTLFYARQDVDSGNYFAADKLLDEFVRTHPNTRESREISFWKSAYVLDPGNERGSLEAGITGLDAYLGANPSGWYRDEATLLRRTAAVAQGVAGTARLAAANDSSTTTPAVKDTVIVVTRSRDEQIAALRDQLAQSKAELAKVSAELDRIKKR